MGSYEDQPLPCRYCQVSEILLQRHRLIVGPFNKEAPVIKPFDCKRFAWAYNRRPRPFQAVEAFWIKVAALMCAATPSRNFDFLFRQFVSSMESISGNRANLQLKDMGIALLLFAGGQDIVEQCGQKAVVGWIGAAWLADFGMNEDQFHHRRRSQNR